MKTIYFFSGLGADSSVFKKIRTKGHQVVHLDWITPLKGETLNHYAQRLGAAVQPIGGIYVGLSFGGLVAQELATVKRPDHLILLASVRSPKEYPFHIRVLKPFGFLVPRNIKLFSGIIAWFMGAQTQRSQELLRRFIDQVDPVFAQWAVRRVLAWKGCKVKAPITSIHGDSDKIFPAVSAKPDHIIPAAGHFFTIDHALELNEILEPLLRD